MLYGPLHGAKISKTNQYLATVIRECCIICHPFRQSNATIVCAAVCLSAMGAGTGLSWTSPVLPQLDNLNGTLVSGNGTLYMDPDQRKSSH